MKYWIFSILVIPVLVHLLNFRRRKKLFYSNVSLLKEVKQQTNRKERLFEFFLLLVRTLALLAFCLLWNSRSNSSEIESNYAVFLDDSRSSILTSNGNSNIDNAKTLVEEMLLAEASVEVVNKELKGQKVSLTNVKEKLSEVHSKDIEFADCLFEEGSDQRVFISPFSKSSKFEWIDSSLSYDFIQLPSNKVEYPILDSAYLLKEGGSYQLRVELENPTPKIKMDVVFDGNLVNSSVLSDDNLLIDLGEVLDLRPLKLSFVDIETTSILFERFYQVSGWEKKKVVFVGEGSPFIKNVYGDSTKFEFYAIDAVQDFEFLFDADMVYIEYDKSQATEQLSLLNTVLAQGVKATVVLNEKTKFSEFDVELIGVDTVESNISVSSTSIFSDVLQSKKSNTSSPLVTYRNQLLAGVNPILKDQFGFTLIGQVISQPNLYLSAVDIVHKNDFTLSGFWLPVAYKLVETDNGLLYHNPGDYLMLPNSFKGVDNVEILLHDRPIKLRVISQGGVSLVAIPREIESGFHQIKNGQKVLNYAVNFDYQKSDFEFYDKSALNEILKVKNVNVYNYREFIAKEGFSTSLTEEFPRWKWFVLITIVMLFIEMIVVRLKKRV